MKNSASDAIRELYIRKPQIGEPFNKLDIYRALRNVSGVLDVKDVEVVNKVGDNYSDIQFNINENMSDDERYINIPLNAIYEIKFLQTDIKGTIF